MPQTSWASFRVIFSPLLSFPIFCILLFFSISIHTTQIYPGRHREFNLRLIICLFFLLCVHAVMYHALARACNQSALPHNMPPVFTRTQHVLTRVSKVHLQRFFPIYGAKLTCLCVVLVRRLDGLIGSFGMVSNFHNL